MDGSVRDEGLIVLKKEMLLCTAGDTGIVLLNITLEAGANGGVTVFDTRMDRSITAFDRESTSGRWYTVIPGRLKVEADNGWGVDVTASKGVVDTDGSTYIDLIEAEDGEINLEVVTMS